MQTWQRVVMWTMGGMTLLWMWQTSEAIRQLREDVMAVSSLAHLTTAMALDETLKPLVQEKVRQQQSVRRRHWWNRK